MKTLYFYLSITFFFIFDSLFCQNIEIKFQKTIDSVYQQNKDAVGLLFHIESPNNSISWSSSIGFSDKKTEQKLDKNQPVLVASNTKTFVATAILKLVENGKITLNQPIKKLLSCKTKTILEQDDYELNKITIKHLLSHTSGIDDYVNDAYFDFINNNKQHKWTRNKQIKLSVKTGHYLSKPGEKFKYADINYLLLTEIIEKITKQPFYKSIRNLIDYKKHHLNNTWFVDLEKKPINTKPLAHQYYNKYNWDSYDLNPSWDLFGGGGIASTTKDMSLFFQALFTGKIIKNKKFISQNADVFFT